MHVCAILCMNLVACMLVHVCWWVHVGECMRVNDAC